MPKISVILAVYNSDAYLSSSIESILNQTFQDYELIIINDASTDNTQSIIEKYSSISRKIKYVINSTNKGVAYSRNRGVILSNGDLIAIQDADDISLPKRLQKQFDFFKEVDVLGSLAYKINEGNKNIGLLNYPYFFYKMGVKSIINLRLSPVIDPSSMFRKDIFVKHGLYSLDPKFRTAQDFELWCRLLNHGYKIANILEPLINYRINSSGVTSTKYKEMREATNEIHKMFIEKKLIDPVFTREDYNEKGIV